MAIYFTEERGYFVDSFGRPPSYFEFEYLINENCATWMYNNVELQSLESNTCGYYVISFCLSILNRMSYYDYISMFTDNFALTNFIDKMVRISSVCIFILKKIFAWNK